MIKKKRLAFIDLVRVIAIALVLLCHSVSEGIYDFSLDSMSLMTAEEQIFPFLIFTMGRLGVPLFLLITGYLLLDREYSTESMIKFWKSNWMHLIICAQFWFILYDMFLVIFEGTHVSFNHIIVDILFLHKVEISSAWYLPMIIGVYVLLPLAANALHTIENKKTLFIPLLFFFIILFIYPTIAVFCKVSGIGGFELSNQISSGYSGGIYGIYLLCGFLLRHNAIHQVKRKYLVLLGGSSFALGVVIQLWAYSNQVKYTIWYDSPFLIVSAIAIFELLSRLNIEQYRKLLAWLAGYSFALYVIHFPLKLLLSNWVMQLSVYRLLQVFIIWILMGVLSLFVAIIISLIPGVGNYILYRKEFFWVEKEKPHEEVHR